ncbi:MAG: pyruvate,water dikinase [Sulfurimonas sp.]|jgi:pyruvate,water dikinase|uniref:PEP/pyruvate-binding domain-containing protein n=1 Tax=Sulfurimonas sp. TaxID=2022749 RepID=UPI0039E49165
MKYFQYINCTNKANNNHSSAAVNIPNGFTTKDDVYLLFLQTDALQSQLEKILNNCDFSNSQTLDTKGDEIRSLIFNTPLPVDVRDELSLVYDTLSTYYDTAAFNEALHSKTQKIGLEDIHLDTVNHLYIGNSGTDLLCEKIQERYASLFSNRAIHYRHSRGYNHFSFTPNLSMELKQIRLNEKYLKLTVA